MRKSGPLIVGVGGFQSNVGKTTLLCELMKLRPGWEAIKTTRGHYRSCGKDPHSCCVSHLLSDHPIIYSGREETYTVAKDTGRYWDAGAANVHWVIATDDQIEQGIHEALRRVRTPGVFIEGNSFSNFVMPDLMFMLARLGNRQVKTSARKALAKTSGLVLTNDLFEAVSKGEEREFVTWLSSVNISFIPTIYSWQDLTILDSKVDELLSSIAA
jgi:hypothetical protein